MASKLTALTHKIAIQPHLVAESCTICSSGSRRPVRKLLSSTTEFHMNNCSFSLVTTKILDAKYHLSRYSCYFTFYKGKCLKVYFKFSGRSVTRQNFRVRRYIKFFRVDINTVVELNFEVGGGGVVANVMIFMKPCPFLQSVGGLMYMFTRV
jgi:hypothetical protein